MMKEIHEQPKAVQDTLSSVIKIIVLIYHQLKLQKRKFRNLNIYILLHVVQLGMLEWQHSM